ncbi:MAG TPA: AAA family ATPase [Gemmatimonadales bacterium]|nr:AAA family ATPase [Gemmatimonadales bacterium]
MRLSRLELSGFKSFAGSVELPFEQGVTGIVGPNGCGKSNISDAVRWVLGEQSPRLLRGGKMEDVIFQGSTGRRPVNVAEVSLVFDNSDGSLPIAYQEVVVTRRLSRSGQSDYLLNRSPVRLRDIQDLLRGTGLGADAAVVMEAKMIEALLSEKAEERRALFEEAAGIGLYRDRKKSTERRLEETAADLARLEDLIAEVQTQVRSLARQRGRAERYGKMIEERFGIAMTLVRRELEDLDLSLGALGVRARELADTLPAARARLAEGEREREARVQARHTAEARRTEVVRRLADARLEVGRLENDLALAAERLGNAGQRRQTAADERVQAEARAAQAGREHEAAAAERAAAERDLAAVQGELAARTGEEDNVRGRLTAERLAVRELEEALQRHAETARALEIEGGALDRERTEVRDQLALASEERRDRETAASEATRAAEAAAQRVSRDAQTAVRAVEALQHARRHVGTLREQEMSARSARRQTEAALAQLEARRDALSELDREHVGLAPAAQALLKVRTQFGDGVLGPLADFVRTSRRDAELAERLLGEWLHAVLVRDASVIDAIRAWHAETEPGPLVLLPAVPGPRLGADGHPLKDELRVDGPAAAWVRALLAGHEVLAGGALRRANGAVFLDSAAPAAGPLQRRAELEALEKEVREAEANRDRAHAAEESTVKELASAEAALTAAGHAAEQARHLELEAGAERGEADRGLIHARRQAEESAAQVERLTRRLAEVETRLGALHVELQEREVERVRSAEQLGAERAGLADLEAQQEAAREQRVRWQVEAAQVEARLAAATERAARAAAEATASREQAAARAEEIARIERETTSLTTQRAQWEDTLQERRLALIELETAAQESEAQVGMSEADLAQAEGALDQARKALAALGEEEHRLQLERTEVEGRKRGLVERVETEWRKPLDTLLAEAPEISGDIEWLRQENDRLRGAIDAVGPVNALAVEEHAEETKRLEFLQTQRDDLVSARSSLQQAAREIDQTAKTLFLESFAKVREHFRSVFQTLFGGGECDVRLANEDEPLESEIEIHAAPRGKRTQRIHLLSSGERTLVAVSLLFAIFLAKPSPFCLLDEVDAPLDDANVGRYVRLLTQFKDQTQFIVITHNPRTMQAADAVYGVTMQEPGVSTIVGVRLGQMEPV